MRRKYHALLIAVALCSATVGVNSCARNKIPIFEGTPGKPVLLLSGLRSYMSLMEARRTISSKYWRVIEDIDRPTTPPTGCGGADFTVRRTTVFVRRHVLEGVEGDLKLEFINGLLLMSLFFPRNNPQYLIRTAQRLGLKPQLDEGVFTGQVSRQMDGLTTTVTERSYVLEDTWLRSFSGY